MTRKQCDTCAFKAGCVTHESEPHNRLRGMIAALGGIPFHCHHSPSGDWHDLTLGELNAGEAAALRKELPICQGWRAEVKALASRGHFSRVAADVRKLVAVCALQAINRFLNPETNTAKNEAMIDLERSLKLLKQKPQKC